jgi:ribosomal protein S18 acetylase RimI-like enzyme
MLKNFYLPTASYYPGIRGLLDIAWLFDACVESLGVEKGREFLGELRECLKTEDVPELGPDWRVSETLKAYLKRLEAEYRPPLPLQNAISRFREWEATNPKATPKAREQVILDLFRLYGIEAFGNLGRYTLYRKTYFAKASEDAKAAFDRLLKGMFANPDIRPTNMVELSDLQAGLSEEADRMVFSRLVFPAGRSARPVDVRAIGEKERGHVVVTSHVRDRSGEAYTVREPVEPAEIGRLFRLYLESGMPLSLDDPAQYLLAIDGEDRIVGGICYKLLDDTSSHMDGVVISSGLRGNGLGGELLEEFALRMQAQGVRAINTHFISRPFLRAHGFVVDEEWGGLVRFLEEAEAA